MKKHMPDLLLYAGAGSVSYGAWLWFEPAGFLTAGTLLLAFGYLTAGK
jgi:hypothetical protein